MKASIIFIDSKSKKHGHIFCQMEKNMAVFLSFTKNLFTFDKK